MIEPTLTAADAPASPASPGRKPRFTGKPARSMPVPKALARAPMDGPKVPTLADRIARAQLVPVRLGKNVCVSGTCLKLALWTIWAQDEAWHTIEDLADCMGVANSCAYAAIKALKQINLITETGRRGPYCGGGRTFRINREELLKYYGTRAIKRKRGHALTDASKKQLDRAREARWAKYHAQQAAKAAEQLQPA